MNGSVLILDDDARTLAFIKAGQLLALPTTGGEPRVLVERGNFGWGDLAWTPDGRWLLYVVNQFSGGRRVRCVLRKVAATGGESAEILTREDAIYRLRLHPDGRRIAFESGEWAGEVWVMENLPAAQGEERGEHGRSGL